MTNLILAINDEITRTAYYMLTLVGESETDPSDRVPMGKYWWRDGSAGSANLIHSKLYPKGIIACDDPDVIQDAQRLAKGLGDDYTAVVMAGGATDWIRCSNGWYRGAIHLGYGCLTLNFCSYGYIRFAGTRKTYAEWNSYGHSWVYYGEEVWQDVYTSDDVLTFTPSYWYSKCQSSLIWGLYGRRGDAPYGKGTVPDVQYSNAFDYRYNEMDTFWSVKDLGVCMDATHARAWASAYTEAASRLPQASCNMIANVVEALTSLHNLVKGRGLSIPKTAGDAWLTYRYVYNTTRSDLDEIMALTQRLSALSEGCKRFTTYGSYHYGEVEYRCGITLGLDQVLPTNLTQIASRYGLKLDLVNIWDMIPYSFVVDWFLDIGGMLEQFEAHQAALKLRPTSVWYSLTSRYNVDSGFQETYVRVQGSNGPPSALPYYTRSNASNTTLMMRVVDSFALFFE